MAGAGGVVAARAATAAGNTRIGGLVLASLKTINDYLGDTSFKIAYRSRNEIMLYCVERMKDNTPFARALDEAISMKILSRIEGDEQRITDGWLKGLATTISGELKDANCTLCTAKIAEMETQLKRGYASFWTR